MYLSLQRTGDACASLSLEEIQSVIDHANTHAQESVESKFTCCLDTLHSCLITSLTSITLSITSLYHHPAYYHPPSLPFLSPVAQAIHTINVTLASQEDSAATLEAIKSPILALRSITDECSDNYHQKLLEAQRNKTKDAGREGICASVKL